MMPPRRGRPRINQLIPLEEGQRDDGPIPQQQPEPR